MATHATLKTLTPSFDPAIKVELLDRAQAEAERLNRFIGNLLDMTRLESGDLNIALAPIDVMETVEAALERAAPLMMGRPVIVDIPADLPMARADFLLLEQVIFNLLDNAAKYAPVGGSITISSRAAGDFVTIEIMDEGHGIAPESRAAIFDKFTRLRREDRQRPGTGLGLAICRGFLEAMGGQITVRNRTDRSGAIFAVTLGKIDIAAEIGSPVPVL
jgi:two-component system sensor histidine kinase KdpD